MAWHCRIIYIVIIIFNFLQASVRDFELWPSLVDSEVGETVEGQMEMAQRSDLWSCAFALLASASDTKTTNITFLLLQTRGTNVISRHAIASYRHLVGCVTPCVRVCVTIRKLTCTYLWLQSDQTVFECNRDPSFLVRVSRKVHALRKAVSFSLLPKPSLVADTEDVISFK